MVTYSRTILTRFSTIWMLLLLTATAATAQPWPWGPTQKMDLQGDLMLNVPSLALLNYCGPNNQGVDPNGIHCSGSNGVANGLKAGRVWTVATMFYTNPNDRAQIYAAAATTAHFTHYALQVTSCAADFYDGLYPTCDSLPQKYGVATYGDVVNQILTEIIESGLIPICTGVAPGIPPVPGLNKALCPVAMNDFDGDSRASETVMNAECRIAAVSAAFPNARVYYELPEGAYRPASGGACSPIAVPSNGQTVPSLGEGDPWIFAIKQKYPNFSGVLYELSGVGDYVTPLQTNVSYLQGLHNFWRNTQEVQFEVDTFQKVWKNIGASPGVSYDSYNYSLAQQVPWLHGYMSGGASHSAQPHVLSDFTGDGKADIAVVRKTLFQEVWQWLASPPQSGSSSYGFGNLEDIPVPADYDGDGKIDLATWRPSDGYWRWSPSSGGFTTTVAIPWGGQVAGDIPLAGDYDGDGKADLVIVRPSANTWFVLRSSGSYLPGNAVSYTWGTTGDIPLPGDFDGDGIADLALYRPSSGTWSFAMSSSGYTVQPAYSFGGSTDIPVPADYDGDGKTDIAVYRPGTGTWYILMSSTGFTVWESFQWGGSTDIPAPLDYNGDGMAELAVFRPSDGNWYIRGVNGNLPINWGSTGDIPVSIKPYPKNPPQ